MVITEAKWTSVTSLGSNFEDNRDDYGKIYDLYKVEFIRQLLSNKMFHLISQDDLEEASEDDIIAAIPDPLADEIDLVWTEFLPLGINLVVNDKSGMVKVNIFLV